jgi:hypothetical protein
MREGMSVRSTVGVGKMRTREIPVAIRGAITRERYARLPDGSCGELLGVDTVENTIHNKDKIMEVLLGITDSHFSQTQAYLVMSSTQGGGGTFVKAGANALVTATAANANGANYEWKFEDNTINTYSANWGRLYNGNPSVFDGTEDGLQAWYISEVNPAFGNKPATENWHYRYQLEFYSSDSDIKVGGMTRLHQILQGDTSAHLTAANARLQPKDGSNNSVGAVITASSRTQPTTTSVEFTFVSADGANNGTWANTQVYHVAAGIGNATLREGGCKQDSTSCGTKAGGEEWTYRWRLSI